MDFRVESNNQANMFLVDGGNDRVGIGTNSPATTLHIHTNSSDSQEIFFDNDGVGSVGVTFRTDFATDAGLANFIRFDASDESGNNTRYSTIESFIVDNTETTEDGRLTFSTMVAGTDTETMHITKGMVGVGTADPQYLLDAYKAAGTNQDVFAVRGSTSAFLVQCSDLGAANPVWNLRTFAGEDLTLKPGNSEAVRIKSDGKVGIGTTNPNNTLHVHTASAGSVTADTDRDDLVIENSTNVGLTFLSPNTDKAAIAFGDPQNSRMGLITYDHAHDSLAIRVNNTDNLLTVQSGGEVGVGGTGQHGALFTVHGDSSITGELRTVGKMGIGGANTANTDGVHIIGADLSNDDDLIVLGGNFSSATILGSIGTHHTDVNNGGLKFSSKTAGTLTEYMRIDKDGKVGIGTTYPSEELEIYSTASAPVSAIIETNQDQEASLKLKNSQGEWEIKADNGADAFRIADVGTASGFSIEKAERLVLEGLANLGHSLLFMAILV